MTREELDDKLQQLFEEPGTSYEDFFDIHTLSGSTPDFECVHLTQRARDEVKQLIRDCIEAVTPEERVAPDVSKHPTFFNIANGHNQAIDTIEANTRELLKKEP